MAYKSTKLEQYKLKYERDTRRRKFQPSAWLLKKCLLDSNRNRKRMDNRRRLIQLRKWYRRRSLLFIRGAVSFFTMKWLKSIDLSKYLCIIKTVSISITKGKKVMAKNSNKSTPVEGEIVNKKAPKTMKENFSSVIMGIYDLLVVASIGYLVTVVVMGTEGIVPEILAAPAALYAVIRLCKKFINNK